jgi:hypothetical protein
MARPLTTTKRQQQEKTGKKSGYSSFQPNHQEQVGLGRFRGPHFNVLRV